MALVTVQRSPTPSSGSPDPSISSEDGSQSPTRLRSLSESYFTVKGAALVLPRSECVRHVTAIPTSGSSIQSHLQSMFYLLRPQDTIKIAVKLESLSKPDHVRYIVIVSCVGRQDTVESIILGVDCGSRVASIGLVLPVWADATVTLDGDGGFSLSSASRLHIFKPVSIQAMWSALQSLHRVIDTARCCNYFPGGLTHTWISYYEAKLASTQEEINEWNAMPDVEVCRADKFLFTGECATDTDEDVRKKMIRAKLKEIMMTVDLEESTSKYLRTSLEEALGIKLTHLRSFVDNEMINILRQMDAATPIFDFLYLGSEWNASNLDELRHNNVGFILNVTREIDNFFPGYFQYYNVRVYDDENADLLRSWDRTYSFIKQAQDAGSNVLVHCKMGISRSASTVIAYIMKALKWDLDRSLKFVKEKRTCIRPNKNFQRQLKTYEGILEASRNRDNAQWRSTDDSSLGGGSGGGGGGVLGFRSSEVDDGEIVASNEDDDLFMRSFSHPPASSDDFPSVFLPMSLSDPPPRVDASNVRSQTPPTAKAATPLDDPIGRRKSPGLDASRTPDVGRRLEAPETTPRPRSWSPADASSPSVTQYSFAAPPPPPPPPAGPILSVPVAATGKSIGAFLSIGGAVVDSSQTDPASEVDAAGDGKKKAATSTRLSAPGTQTSPTASMKIVGVSHSLPNPLHSNEQSTNLPSLSLIRNELRKIQDFRTQMRDQAPMGAASCLPAAASAATAASGASVSVARKDSWSSSSSGGTGGSHEELNFLEDSLMGITGCAAPRVDSGYTSATAADESAGAAAVEAVLFRVGGDEDDEGKEPENARTDADNHRPNSIYDAEDIPWTPGTVRKTTKHYEERTMTGESSLADSQQFPVQRSKSLRLEKPRPSESPLKRAISCDGDRCGRERSGHADAAPAAARRDRAGLKGASRSLPPEMRNKDSSVGPVLTLPPPPQPLLTLPPPDCPTSSALECESCAGKEVASPTAEGKDSALTYRIKGDAIPLQVGKVRRHTQELERLKSADCNPEDSRSSPTINEPLPQPTVSRPAILPASRVSLQAADTERFLESGVDVADNDGVRSDRSASESRRHHGAHAARSREGAARKRGEDIEAPGIFRRDSLRASLVSAASAKLAHHRDAVGTGVTNEADATIGNSTPSEEQTSPLSRSAPTAKSGYLAKYAAEALRSSGAVSGCDGAQDFVHAEGTRQAFVRSSVSPPSSVVASGDHRSPAEASDVFVDSARRSRGAKEFTGVRKLVGEFERKRHTLGGFSLSSTEEDSLRLTTVSCPPENLQVLLEDPVVIPADVSSFNAFRSRRHKNQSPTKHPSKTRPPDSSGQDQVAAPNPATAPNTAVAAPNTAVAAPSSKPARTKPQILSLPGPKATNSNRAFANLDPAFYHTM